jgi:NAD(P)-binding Rossmann-like domain
MISPNRKAGQPQGKADSLVGPWLIKSNDATMKTQAQHPVSDGVARALTCVICSIAGPHQLSGLRPAVRSLVDPRPGQISPQPKKKKNSIDKGARRTKHVTLTPESQQLPSYAENRDQIFYTRRIPTSVPSTQAANMPAPPKMKTELTEYSHRRGTEGPYADNLNVDVLIIGAGFGGVFCLKTLRELGYNTVIYEAGMDLGGTWRWNRYTASLNLRFHNLE